MHDLALYRKYRPKTFKEVLGQDHIVKVLESSVETNKISHAYLENILITLKSRNLIRTTRGANGGFTLKTSPEKITMFDIISAFDGDSRANSRIHPSG